MPAALPLASASFAAGILLAGGVECALQWLFTATAVMAGISLFFYWRRLSALIPLLLLMTLLGATCLRLEEQRVFSPWQAAYGKETVLTGHISRADNGGEGWVAFHFFAAELEAGGMSMPPGQARITVTGVPHWFLPQYGLRLRVRGAPSEPAGKRNPGGFDYKTYLAETGTGAVMSVRFTDLELLPGRGGNPLHYLAERGRQKALLLFTQNLPEREAGLAAGLILGERDTVAGDTTEAFRMLGIAHLLAVSGLHVGFVAALALFLFTRLTKGRKNLLSSLLAVLVILVYVLLTGGRPSVWRAALMFVLGGLARLAGRDADGLQSIAAAAILLLFFKPYWLFGPSFQFSFLATAGILLLSANIRQRLHRLPAWLAGPLAVTVAAQLAVLPLQIPRFGQLPLLSLPANLFCVLLAGAAIALGLTGLFTGFIAPVLALPFCTAAYLPLTILEKLPRLIAALPFSSLSVHTVPPVVWLPVFAVPVAYFAGVRFRPTPGKTVLASLLILNLAVAGTHPVFARGQLEVVFLDVGQGLAVHVATPSGRQILIDAGGGMRNDPGKHFVLPYLRNRRIGALDLLVLTHPHADHYGGLNSVAGHIPAGMFLSSGDKEDSDAFRSLLALLHEKKIPLRQVVEGSRVILDRDIYMDVLSPPQKRFRYTGEDENNNSLVLRITYGSFSLLITGDAEREAIARLVKEKKDIRSTVLQVPHHGSRRAPDDTFFAALGAEAAVISVGRNRFGHPHPDTLEMLQRNRVAVYRTDIHGAVTVTSNGSVWQISGFNNKVAAGL